MCTLRPLAVEPTEESASKPSLHAARSVRSNLNLRGAEGAFGLALGDLSCHCRAVKRISRIAGMKSVMVQSAASQSPAPASLQSGLSIDP